jgi:isopenicillin N synthase-like dioxygenase
LCFDANQQFVYEPSPKTWPKDLFQLFPLKVISNFSIQKFEEAHKLTDFESREEEITKQLVEAAENAGFLTLVDHGISVEEIEAQFSISKAFFGLYPEIKGKTPHSRKDNNGWEYMVGPVSTRKWT